MSVQTNGDVPSGSETNLTTRSTYVERELQGIWQELGVIKATMATMATKQDLADVYHELKLDVTQLREETRTGFVAQQAKFDSVFAEHRQQTREEFLGLQCQMKNMQADNKAAIADSRTATITWVAGIVFIGQLIPVLARVAERYV